MELNIKLATFQDNSYIEFKERGNTYVGDIANYIGHKLRRYARTQQEEFEYIRKLALEKPGIVLFSE